MISYLNGKEITFSYSRYVYHGESILEKTYTQLLSTYLFILNVHVK